MSQNIFAGWPEIREKEPEFNEIWNNSNKNELLNIKPGWGLYKPFDIQEKSTWESTGEINDWEFIQEKGIWETNQESISWTETKEQLNKKDFKNNIYYPNFERLFETQKISFETFENLTQKLIDWKNDFSKIDDVDKEELEIILNIVETLDTAQENDSIWNMEEFLSDNSDISKKIEKKEYSLFEEELYNKIWKNYIKIDTWNIEADKKENLSTAIKTTSNEIITNYKNVQKQSVTYQKAIIDIASNNIQRQFEWLHSLYLLAVTNEWASWSKMEKSKKMLTEAIKNKKDSIIKQAIELNNQIKIAKEEKNEIKLKDLLLEKQNLIDESIEIEDWIFWWNIDLETNDWNNWSFDNISDKKI